MNMAGYSGYQTPSPLNVERGEAWRVSGVISQYDMIAYDAFPDSLFNAAALQSTAGRGFTFMDLPGETAYAWDRWIGYR